MIMDMLCTLVPLNLPDILKPDSHWESPSKLYQVLQCCAKPDCKYFHRDIIYLWYGCPLYFGAPEVARYPETQLPATRIRFCDGTQNHTANIFIQISDIYERDALVWQIHQVCLLLLNILQISNFPLFFLTTRTLSSHLFLTVHWVGPFMPGGSRLFGPLFAKHFTDIKFFSVPLFWQSRL